MTNTSPENRQKYSIPSGMGGAFTVSIIEEHAGGVVKVRVHYPSADWDGHTFYTTRDRLTAI